MPSEALLPIERVETLILFVRGERVILDADIAGLYGVETKALVRAVKRNLDRFPDDFMFQLTAEETVRLRCQIGTSNDRAGRGGRREIPNSFKEQGVSIMSGVMRSERGTPVNQEIMRAFVRLRRMVSQQADLARKLDDLEQRYDEQFSVVFDALRELMAPPDAEGRPIGFRQG